MLTPGERKASESLAGFKRALAELDTQVATRVGAAANAKAARELRDVVKENAPFDDQGPSKKHGRLYGHLRDNIRVRRPKAQKQHHIVHQVTTGRGFWGYFLEFGTTRMLAMPWFRPILEIVGGRIMQLRADELGRGIERAAKRAARHAKRRP